MLGARSIKMTSFMAVEQAAGSPSGLWITRTLGCGLTATRLGQRTSGRTA
jgi:hypothetical protein